jgi:hypothetical protein
MKKFILLITIIFLGYMLFAQPADPGSGGFDDPVGHDDETEVPFGIEWLVIGGVAYGLTKIKKKKKKN